MTKSISNLAIIHRILPYFWPKKPIKIRFLVVLSVLLAVFTILFDLTVPMLFKNIVALFETSESPPHTIMLLIACYGILWAFVRISDKLKEIALFRPLCRLITDFSLAAFKHVHLLDFEFHIDKETGRVAGAINRSQFALAMVITNLFFRIIPTIFGILCAFWILWYLYSLFYGLVLLIIFCIDLLFILYTTKFLIQYQDLSDARNLEEDAKILDSLFNIETVKFFNQRKTELAKAQVLYEASRQADLRLLKTQTGIELIHSCIIGFGLIFSNYQVGIDVFKGKLHVLDFILINGYMLVFLSALHLMGYWFRYVIMRLAQIKPIEQLFRKTSILKENDKAKHLEIETPVIQFNKVNFSYKHDHVVLKDLSFEIPGKSIIGIIGSTGSGKSTISRLLLRHYDPTSGEICIDKQNIRDVTVSSLRKAIGIVPQHVILFNNTLQYNLCYGSFEASNEEIMDVLRQVSLDNFVHCLPKGLLTPVGEGGLKLSGGERQRIAIARVLLRKPNILIFDEATSSLDSKTEKVIQESIEQVSHGRTSIIIAHRLSTVVHAKKIFVLHEGEIAESGTHKELLNRHGIYSALWNLQKKEKDKEWRSLE